MKLSAINDPAPFPTVACSNSDEDQPVTQGNQEIQDLQAENEQLKAELDAS